jgi:hypothetical protein
VTLAEKNRRGTSGDLVLDAMRNLRSDWRLRQAREGRAIVSFG